MSTLDDSIAALEKAIARTEERMREIEAPFSFPRDCCPMCACGGEWNALADKLPRQAFVLARLYVKRGDADDARRERCLWIEYGGHSCEQWAQWRMRRALARLRAIGTPRFVSPNTEAQS